MNQWRATWTAPASVNDGNYQVRAVALSTTRYLGNNASTAFQLELGPPDDVSALTATPGDGKIQLDWQRPAAADLDHYEISRSNSATFVGDPSWGDHPNSSFYTDDALTNGRDFYKVVAVDIFGQASDGVVVSRTPAIGPETTPPYPPSNLTWLADVNGLTITLNWTASLGDVVTGSETGLGDYYLYQAADPGGPWTEIWHGAAVIQSVTHAAYIRRCTTESPPRTWR